MGLKIAVIGYGAIGRERIKALQQLFKEGHPIESIRVYDPYIPKGSIEIWSFDSFDEIRQHNPDWVIVATPHDVAPKIVKDVLSWNDRIKVLMEKPFGRSFEEASDIYYSSNLDTNDRLFVGFNYRFFEPLAQLINDTARLEFGDIISINMKIGHGGNPQLRESWKLNSNSGGVEVLCDPGIHLLDLLSYFCMNPEPIFGKAWSGFWNNNMNEEVHLLLKDYDTIINLESSIVKWCNTFYIEINGTESYGIVEGRGGNYGPQTYTRGKRWGWQNGKSQKESEELVVTSDCKDSFKKELEYLLFGKQTLFSLPPCDANDAMQTMELYNECMKVIE